MKSHFLFATLSLVSGVNKYRDREQGSIKGMEIEKNSAFVITGVYSNVNDFWGINVQNTGTEDYFYTFDLEDDPKIYKNKKEVDFTQIKEGDKLKVTYDGSISLVYPPKLNNVTKIEVVEDDLSNK